MIYLILGILLGIYAEWKWQFADNLIESIKIHLNIKK
jgi:hypothetical protein